MRVAPADAALGAAALLGGAVFWWSGRRIVADASSHSTAGIEEILGFSSAAAGIGALIWWVIAASAAVTAQLLTTGGHRHGASVAARFSPTFMRRLAAAALGMNLLAAPTMASAAPALLSSSTLEDLEAPHSAENTSSGLTTEIPAGENPPAGEFPCMVEAAPHWKPLPEPSAGGLVMRSDTARVPEAVDSGATEIIVKQGDSLWSLTAAHLGPFATDVEVAAAWPSWHQANREVIGENPSLLFPGQILRIPTAP